MYLRHNRVYHVGTMDAQNRNKRYSFEGDALSVSLHPRAWQRIARLMGLRWELRKSEGKFLDMLKPEVIQQLVSLGTAEGLLEKKELYRLYTYDCELDDEVFVTYASREEAEQDAELEDEPRIAAVTEVCGTERLRRAYPLVTASDCHGDTALTVAANTLAAVGEFELLEGVDGLWWDERLAPECLSAPRGSIFPHMVPTWAANKQD